MKLLERKTAIITGASRGIGRCLAKTFSAHGCNVAFTYNSNKDAAENLVADLKDSNVTIKAYQSNAAHFKACLLYTSPSPRDLSTSRMPSSA